MFFKIVHTRIKLVLIGVFLIFLIIIMRVFYIQVFEYKKSTIKIEYTIKFKDGKDITESSYDWFISNIENLSIIKDISMYCRISYSSNIKNKEKYEYIHVDTFIHFYEDQISLRVDGDNAEEQTRQRSLPSSPSSLIKLSGDASECIGIP